MTVYWHASRLILAAMPIGFLALGLIILAFSVDAWQTGRNSQHWPSVQGTVLSGEITIKLLKFGTEYEPRLAYRYVVAGEIYVGTVGRTGGFGYRDRAQAEAKLAAYPVGSTVTVRFNPARPSHSVLEPGIGSSWWLNTSTGLVFGVIGVIILGQRAREWWQARATAEVGSVASRRPRPKRRARHR